MIEDELTILLKNTDAEALDKINEQAKKVSQDLASTGVDTNDPEAMKKMGYVFNGYGWVKL